MRNAGIVSFLSVVVWWAQIPANVQAQGNDIRFKGISTKQGLSHPDVSCIEQDSKGYLWFGTRQGLNRYDGYAIQSFTRSQGLSSDCIQALYEDRAGYLWIGTCDGGLNRYDRRTNGFVVFQNNPQNPTSISSNNIKAISQDRRGNVWIGTSDGGLCKYLPETRSFKTYRHSPSNPTSLGSNSVYSIHEDKPGFLWLGTGPSGGGLCRFNPRTEVCYTYLHDPGNPASLGGNDAYCLYEDRRGFLWVGTYGKGLSRYDRTTNQFKTYRHEGLQSHSLSNDYVVDIREDSLGTLWVATRGGLNRFDPQREQFTAYQPDPRDFNSLSSPTLNALFLDQSGSLWIGTDHGGVNKFDTRNLVFHAFISNPGNPAGFRAKSVTSLFKDSRQALWVGTLENGLYRYDREKDQFTGYRNQPATSGGLNADHITAIAEDGEKGLWVATGSKGLYRYDRQRQQFVHDDRLDQLGSLAIETLFKDREGRLWIGTREGGLRVLDPSTGQLTVHRYDPDNHRSLGSNNVRVVYQDRTGIIWIGTRESGLSRFDPETRCFSNYRYLPGNTSSLISNAVTAIAEDSQGFLWIGTLDEGLCRFDSHTRTFRRFVPRASFPDNSICGILKDSSGKLWISTPKGLVRLDTRNREMRTYTADDGLYHEGFVHGSAFQSQAGELFFGGNESFVSFNPDAVRENTRVPPVLLTGFNLFNVPAPLAQPLSETREIELAYDQNFFSFEFSRLSYLDPDKNQYAYRLDGFDKDWNYVKQKRNASYTNVGPGKYTFRVKAADQNGVWNGAGTSVSIVIHPAWYATWWFRLAAVLTVLGSGFGYYRRHIRKIERQQAMLEKVVQLRTAELNLRNEQMAAQRDSIEATNLILNAAKQTIEEQNVALKTINNQLEDRVEKRTQELQHTYVKLLESKQELDTFLYRASHDIRGPVARLMGLCKVAMLEVQDAKAIEYLHLLDRTSEETNDTLVRILRIYDIRNVEVNPQPVDLPAFIRSMVEKLESSGKYPRIGVELDLPSAFDFGSDEVLLKTILQNVIENAFRYSLHQDHSFVRIALANAGEAEVCLRITDNGRGIPEESRNKLFTMFFKGAEKASGAGLGLFVSRIAAEKLGGHIHYQRGPQLETIFEIKLPSLVMATPDLVTASK